MTVFFYVIGLRNQDKHFEEIQREHVKELKESFINLEERDSKMLLSTLEVIVQDRSFKELYLKKNREELYAYGQPLFQNLKKRYGITHFYFILPDGRVFLRLHEKGLYGDQVNRFSFQKARDTKNSSLEIELGKTAFALRAVMPYYNAGTLIGYVELGEEINHFLKIMKDISNSDLATIADKKYLDRDDWKSVRQVNNLRDNWDDLENHLVLSSTSEGEMAAKCFIEDNLERIEKGENILQQLNGTYQNFMCGGFDLNDARGRHIGAVLSLTPMSEHVVASKKANKAKLHMAIFIFLLAFIATILVSHSITKPVLELADAARAIGNKGDLDRRVKIRSNDEIGQMGMTFNDMIERLQVSEKELKKHREQLARLVDDRTYELRIAYENLEREMSERKLAEAEAIRASQLAALGELSAGVAHEINNPINGIINYSQMLLSKCDPESKEYDLANRIMKESDRIASIVSNLLTFTRDRKEKKNPVNISEIIADSLALTKAQMEKDGVKLVVNISPGLPLIIANPQQVQQVFLNIMSNARHALNQKYPSAHEDKILEITAHGVILDNKQHVRITFHDHGTGIPDFIIDKAINPFFTTKSGSEGTGLGLSISHGIIKDHDGDLTLASKEGEFTMVMIDLPLKSV